MLAIAAPPFSISHDRRLGGGLEETPSYEWFNSSGAGPLVSRDMVNTSQPLPIETSPHVWDPPQCENMRRKRQYFVPSLILTNQG
jgi:hypothetical protein